MNFNAGKNTILLAVGLGLGPLGHVVATPWLARMYSPDEFGVLAIFIAITSVIGSVACLRFDAAILVVDDADISSTARLALVCAYFIAISIAILFLIDFPSILGINKIVLDKREWQILFTVIGVGAVLAAGGLSLRQESYELNAALRSTQGIVYLASVFFLPFGLVNGWALGWLVASIFASAYIFKTTSFVGIEKLSRQADKLKDYIFRLTPTLLLDSLTLALPILFIGYIYGPYEVGNYSQILKILGAPLLLMSVIVGQLLTVKTGKLYRSQKSSLKLFIESGILLLLAGIFLLIAVIFYGEPLFHWILGDAWRTNTTFILLIALPVICRSIASPLSVVLLTHHRVDKIVLWQSVYFFSNALIFGISYFLQLRIEIYLLLFSIMEFIMYALYVTISFLTVQTKS